jgi:hypothetical protein
MSINFKVQAKKVRCARLLALELAKKQLKSDGMEPAEYLRYFL